MITPLALIPFLRCLLVLPPWNSYVEATRWSLELNVSHWQLPNEWHDSTLCRGDSLSVTIHDPCASKEGEVSSMQEARIDAVNVGWSLERDTVPWFPGRGRNSWQLAAWTGACEEFLTEAGGTPEVSRSQKGIIYVYIHITLQRQKTLYKYLRYIDTQERFSLHGAWVPYLPQLRRFNEVDDSTQAQDLPSRLRCSRANEITNGTKELRETDDASRHGLHPDGNTFERLITCNIEAGLTSNLQDCSPLWIGLVLFWKVARSGWSCRDDQWHKAECEHARSMQLTPTDAA